MDTKQHLNAALALQKAGKTKSAQEIYKEIIGQDPNNTDALHLFGLTYYDQKSYARAHDYISQALKRAPTQAPIHHNLAAVLAIQGDTFAAEGHYREAIRLSPTYAEAFYNLSAIVKLTHNDPIVEQIESLLAKEDLPNSDRSFLHFAAGKFYDDLKQYDRAFEHFRSGNSLKQARYDHGSLEAFCDAIIETCSPELLAMRSRSAFQTTLPVFVVGMPRSGTTLIEQILSSHPSIFGAGELKDIAAISRSIADHSTDGSTYPKLLSSIDQKILNGMAKSYIENLKSLDTGATYVINKMPLNFWHLGLISSSFSGAKIIHCKRDPLDTCLSCYFQNFTSGQDYSFDLADLGHYYSRYTKIMEHWRKTLPLPILEFRYEDLVTHTETVTREILEFLELDWDPACLQFHQTKRNVETASRWQVRQPVYTSSARRSERYDSHLTPLKLALGI